jgi:hypothetical protein
MKESEIQAEILAYLESRGDFYGWRNNSGGYAPRPGQFIKFGKEGSSDILGVHAPSGRFVAIEVKTQTGKVSPAQKRFLDEVDRCGGLGLVARSVADVRVALGAPSVRVVSSGRIFHGAVDG